VVGGRTAKDTAALIEEVARGDRLLEEIKDPDLRETVRLALRLHKDPYSGPDARTRFRIRSRVLDALRPHPATLADRVALAFEVLAKPTPYAMRALAIALVFVCIAASTTLGSAGTVADDPLYSVKIASEQMRLALATTPEDRAVVLLSIAEHRLAEATALAEQGMDDGAIVAASEYGEHLAGAAAELAQIEYLSPETATLVIQLQQKLDQHRATAAAAVARLSGDAEAAPAVEVLAAIARHVAPATDLSPAAAIAEQAASAADRVASVAERNVPVRRTPAPREAPRRALADDDESDDVARVTEARRADSSRATSRGGTGERARSPERAAEFARRAAQEAKAAAQKAKQGSKRTPLPTPHWR
jgi:hypothetical protein